MQNIVRIECPPELLIGLHVDADRFGEMMKLAVAKSLFKEGKISSGMAAKWLGIPRMHFLLQAMEGKAYLLEDNEDDFQREVSLL